MGNAQTPQGIVGVDPNAPSCNQKTKQITAKKLK